MMAHTLFLLLILHILSVSVEGQCTGGQVWTDCGSACDHTCENPRPACTDQCVPKCQCPSDTDIWHQGLCIAIAQCAGLCQGGQVWTGCGTSCVRTCDDPNPTCDTACVTKCQCPADRPLLHNSQCIALSQCTTAGQCLGGRIWSDCGNVCDRTCANPNHMCKAMAPCMPRCVCPPDKYIWHNWQCITLEQCAGQCQGGQVWNTCGSSCVRTCGNPNPSCTTECVTKCECPADRPILHNSQCITLAQCTTNPCPVGQIWTTCGRPCDRTCTNPNPVCIAKCENRCQCPDSSPIIHSGRCITQQECPSNVCPGGQVWNECGSACQITCDNPTITCIAVCVARCQCPPDRPIWSNGQCTSLNQCAGQCQGGQLWTTCGSSCIKTCGNPNPSCDQGCVAKCQCPADKPISHGSQCITSSQCPTTTCLGGAVWNTCASACDKTCAKPNPICTKQCATRCACPSNRPILHKNICITLSQCPPNPCPVGQKWTTCGRACDQTCTNPTPVCTKQCVPRCQCPDQTPIIHTGQCIAQAQCPPSQCPGGKIWTDCGNVCDRTCDNPNFVCPSFACMARCVCPPDKNIWHNGQCIPLQQCSGQCQGGQEWNTCGSSCMRSCGNPNPICDTACVTKCQCPTDRSLLHDSQCIALDQCAPTECTGGAVWTVCASACDKTCSDTNPACTKPCVSKCACPPYKPYLQNGICMTTSQCGANPCPSGQVEKVCGSPCTRTCASPFPACTETCVMKCECPDEKPILHDGQCTTLHTCSTGVSSMHAVTDQLVLVLLILTVGANTGN